jgi:hypothetical protein
MSKSMEPKITYNLVCPTCGTPFPLWVGCSSNFGEKAEYVCDNCCVQEGCDRAIPNLTVECGGAEDAGRATFFSLQGAPIHGMVEALHHHSS